MTDKFQNKYRIPSARMAGWDYGSNALYFVTICTDNRMCCFGDIVNGEMQLSELGKIAHQYWTEIPNHFPFTQLGEFVVMPNHVHGIIEIDKPMHNAQVETLHATSDQKNDLLSATSNNNNDSFHEASDCQDLETLRANETLRATSLQEVRRIQMSQISPKPHSLSTILRSYKSAVSKQAHQLVPDFAWQPRFHDHIIRTDESFQRISEYIRFNPSNWRTDQLYEET